MLLPNGLLCVADLDKEPGLFHTPEAATTVHHHGFDRAELKTQIVQAGFKNVRDSTAHSIRKPVQGGSERDFPMFLLTASPCRAPSTDLAQDRSRRSTGTIPAPARRLERKRPFMESLIFYFCWPVNMPQIST